MELGVLGPVLVDGEPPRGGIERALLARLLVAPGAVVPAEGLIEAGWPPGRRDGAAASLRVRLVSLRRQLPPGALVRDPAGYRLAVEPGTVDAERFTRLARDADRASGEAALARCDEALGLWRGEPFGGLDVPEVAAAARRLHGVRAAIRHRRALSLLETGRAEDAARELAVLVGEDGLNEELVAGLMRARYRAGRHVEALDAYRDLARRLGELGLQPGPAIRELEARVLRHADGSGRRTNVGARVASVVGREADVAAVVDALAAHRLVTLTGPAGVGKTTLAAEVARAALDGPAEGAWVVDLAPLHDATDAMPAAATALGLRRVAGGIGTAEHDALALLHERLRDATLLLVLDGAEHLLPGLARVARDIAGTGPGVRVLVTSRRPLGVPGEAVVAVAPLAVPEGAGDVDASPAGRLFLERARAARPGVAPAGDADAVARICRRLDGLPLALELAAARLRGLSAATIADRLDEGLAVLGRGTLEASIEASDAGLSPFERELLRRLSAFEGPFGLEDAEAVGGDDALEHLLALTEHSMVQCEGESPRRYRLLEAIRAFARAQLDPRAAGAVAHRHAVRLAEIGASAAGLAAVEGPERAGEPLVPRRADLEAAFAYALRRRDADLALDLAAGLHAMHHRLGSVPVGVELAERALAIGAGDPAKRLGVLFWHVPMLLAGHRVADARAALDEAVALAGDDADLRLRLLEGQVGLSAGDLDAAERALAGTPEAFAARGEPFTAGLAAESLGLIAHMHGAPEAAVSLLQAARERFAACSDVCSLDGATASFAAAAVDAGREDEAAAACAETIAAAPERPLAERATQLLHEVAVLAARAGDAERAARFAAAAVTAAGRDPVALGPWHAPAAAGDIALIAGRAPEARRRFEEARALAAAVRGAAGPSLPASLYLCSSELRLAGTADDPAAALAHARAALEHAEGSGAAGVAAAAREALGRLEAAAVTPPS